MAGRMPSRGGFGLWDGLASNWRETRATARLVIGAGFVCLVGLVGMTPHRLFGLELVWPYAAMWAALGWARSGISLRPMLALSLLGLAQDVASEAPLGSLVIVNLATYGAHALALDTLEVQRDRVLERVLPPFSLMVGFFTLWVVASSVADHAVRVWPLVLAWGVTALSYGLVHPLFRLTSASGVPRGMG